MQHDYRPGAHMHNSRDACCFPLLLLYYPEVLPSLLFPSATFILPRGFTFYSLQGRKASLNRGDCPNGGTRPYQNLTQTGKINDVDNPKIVAGVA
jgi:hypothetical protein